jgi:hypothetical protein
MTEDLKAAMTALVGVVADTAVVDQECLMALILCECRVLYKNHDVCGVIEDGPLRVPFGKAHVQLKMRVEFANVKEAVDDIVSMVDLSDKKK